MSKLHLVVISASLSLSLSLSLFSKQQEARRRALTVTQWVLNNSAHTQAVAYLVGQTAAEKIVAEYL